MATLTILQGPPASGKSTLARKMQAQSPLDTVIVSMDALRHARGLYWIPQQEKYINKVERYQVRTALRMGLNVILDDTNLNPNILNSWKEIAANFDAEIKYIRLDVTREECLRRNKNADRDHQVPDEVIHRFFDIYKLDEYAHQSAERGDEPSREERTD